MTSLPHSDAKSRGCRSISKPNHEMSEGVRKLLAEAREWRAFGSSDTTTSHLCWLADDREGLLRELAAERQNSIEIYEQAGFERRDANKLRADANDAVALVGLLRDRMEYAEYERDAARRGVQQLAQALRDAGAFTGEHDALVWSAMCPRHAPEE